jgi:hypothetical protein
MYFQTIKKCKYIPFNFQKDKNIFKNIFQGGRGEHSCYEWVTIFFKILNVSIFFSKNFIRVFLWENIKGSPFNVLSAFSQFYIKHYLRKRKIVVASTTSFFRHYHQI